MCSIRWQRQKPTLQAGDEIPAKENNMRLKIGWFIVDVEARRENEAEVNDEATRAFLTHIECALWQNADFYEGKVDKHQSSAILSKAEAKEIHRFLEQGN